MAGSPEGHEDFTTEGEEAMHRLEKALERRELTRFEVARQVSEKGAMDRLRSVESFCTVLSSTLGFHLMASEMLRSLQSEVALVQASASEAHAQLVERTREHQDQTLAVTTHRITQQLALERQAIHGGVGEAEGLAKHSETEKAGYLFESSPSGRWGKKRGWVVLQGGRIISSLSGSGSKHHDAIPVNICTVKAVVDLPLAFEVISPQGTLRFQASSQIEMQQWIIALRNAIEESLYKSESKKDGDTAEAMARQLKLITAVDGNRYCADCGAPDPVWGSISIGVAFCIECSGVHRSLGAHLSKVRSFQLDVLDDGTLEVLFAIGNTKANQVWEATLPPGTKPVQSSSREIKAEFITSKYRQGAFLPPALQQGKLDELQATMLHAAQQGDAALLAASLKVEDENGELAASEGDILLPAVFAAAEGGHAAVLRLIINESNVNDLAVCNADGKTARQIAREAGHVAVEKLLEEAILAAAAAAAEEAAREALAVALAKEAAEAAEAIEDAARAPDSDEEAYAAYPPRPE